MFDGYPQFLWGSPQCFQKFRKDIAFAIIKYRSFKGLIGFKTAQNYNKSQNNFKE